MPAPVESAEIVDIVRLFAKWCCPTWRGRGVRVYSGKTVQAAAAAGSLLGTKLHRREIK
jgi:hypothetical protein